MKKILLLFVLFLGFSFGAFAANEIEPVEFRSLPKGDITDWIVYDFKDGERVVIDDGTYCIDYWSETTGEGSVYTGTLCP